MHFTIQEDRLKLNATEAAKLDKDGLDVIYDIQRFAQEGPSALNAADYDRLKWIGVYAQRPKSDGYFMLRVKVPGGKLTGLQVERLADIAEQYGRNLIDITTRQSVQFHWIRLEVLPEILEKLEQAGLTSLQAAGDCPRNIIANPISGIDPDEFIDTDPIVEELNAFLHNNRQFSNLPRKFKIAVSGGVFNSVHAEINDLAFVPAVKNHKGKLLKGFQVLVGGGLSQQPQLAVNLHLFILPNEVVKVTAAVATLFRDHGYREKRNHARLKFLVADWGSKKFREELLKITGPLLSGGVALDGGWSAGRFHGVHEQKQEGHYYFGLAIPAGRTSAGIFRDIARIAATYGDNTVRTTNSQGIVVPNIPVRHLPQLETENLYQEQIAVRQSACSHMLACPGKEFCPFGLVETKGLVPVLGEYLDQHAATETPLRIHISGCLHSCSQPQLADIGIQGALIQVDGKPQEAFEVWVGGKLGSGSRLAAKLPERITAEAAPEFIANMVQVYLRDRLSEESFSDYVVRTGEYTRMNGAAGLKRTV